MSFRERKKGLKLQKLILFTLEDEESIVIYVINN